MCSSTSPGGRWWTDLGCLYDSCELGQLGLLGRPGCRIEQRDGGGFLLRSVKTTGPEVLSVDDIVYRAFELLLE